MSKERDELIKEINSLPVDQEKKQGLFALIEAYGITLADKAIETMTTEAELATESVRRDIYTELDPIRNA